MRGDGGGEAKSIPPGGGRRLIVLGDNQTIKLTGKDTGGLFALLEQANPPGVGVPLHVHANEDELFRVVEGSMAFTVAGESMTLGAGGTLFIPRGVPHEFMTVGDATVRTILMAFPSGIEAMFEELARLPAGPPDMAKVVEICGRYGITFLSAPDAGDDSLALA